MRRRGAGELTAKLRIAFIGTRGVPAGEGGVERHVEELGSRLAERGHDVTVYCRTNYVKDRRAVYRGMHLRYVATAGTKHLDFIAHSATSSILMLRRPPDIVHYHAIGSALVAPLPRYLSRSGVVLTVHGLDYARQKWTGAARAALKLAEGLSARVPHETVVVSRALAAHYATRLGREAVYIPNGMPEATVRPLGPIASRLGLDGPYLLFVGRLVPEKAPDLLVRAFARVEGEVRLVVVGSSGFTDAYAESVRRLAAADPRVIMAGGVFGDDLAELYSNAAAFVLPSNLEGLPITLLEAIAHRAPVIVSDIAPHLEVVGLSGPGHRVVPQGDVDALAASMSEVLRNREGETSGAAALFRDVAAEYSWDTVTTATEQVYSRVAARRTSRSTATKSPGSELPV
jgi:glycosyltransferase involved in cell wall biosynthesis